MPEQQKTILEDWVLGIEKVEEIQTDDIRTRGYIIYHQDGVMTLPFYKVHSSTYKKKGSHMVGKPNFDVNSSHYRYFIDRGRSHTSVSYERLVMIADGVYKDSLPNKLRGLQVNVKDCTGNPDTAINLGLKQDFHPANLEWCFDKEHGPHFSTCQKCFEVTGRAWIVSAFDVYLYELTKNGSYDEIAQYLEWFCIPA